MMYSFDAEFGRVVDYLKAQDLFDDSLIVVTSDNGGLQTALDTNRALQGNKGNLGEGGIRVPFFASWPKNIEAEQISNSVTTTYDIMPTFAGIIGAETGEVLGEDFSEALFTPSRSYVRQTPAYFQTRLNSWRRDENEDFSDQRALRDGCYKLTERGNPRGELKLYNLCDDIKESNNLEAADPIQFDSMLQAFKRVSRSVGQVVEGISLNGERLELKDWRLNVHQDDLSIGAVVDIIDSGEVQTVYRRGDTHLYINGQTGQVIFEALGVSNQDIPATYKKISLSGSVDEGDEILLSIRGYIRSGSSVTLSVNGVDVAAVSAPVSSEPNALGNSVYALKNDLSARAYLGDTQLVLQDVSVNLAAQ